MREASSIPRSLPDDLLISNLFLIELQNEATGSDRAYDHKGMVFLLRRMRLSLGKIASGRISGSDAVHEARWALREGPEPKHLCASCLTQREEHLFPFVNGQLANHCYDCNRKKK